MKRVYRVLAYLICLAVAVQAAAIALAFFGLASWVMDGGTLDRAMIESGTAHFDGEQGMALHAISGMMIIPILGLLLLISSFFTRIGKAIGWAGIVLGCIVAQVALGIFGHSLYLVGAVHGLFAFALLGAALYAGTKITRWTRPVPEEPEIDRPLRVPVG